MLPYILMIVISIAVIALNIALIAFYSFLARINLINSGVVALLSGGYLYLGNRHIDAFYDGTVHPAICLGVAVVALLLCLFIQKTKVGFWIFAILFLLVWAFASGLIIYLFVTKGMMWFWLTFVLAFIASISSHIRSRDYEEALSA